MSGWASAPSGISPSSSAAGSPILGGMAANGLALSTLDSAHDLEAACGVVVERLAAGGDLLPSVYLARGGRLRCRAPSGYRQVRDGLSPSAGLIGRAYRTGRDVVVEDARLDPGCLDAVPGVVAAAAIPLHCGPDVVGVLNVESRAPLSDAALARIRAAAASLSERIAQLGGPPAESEARRLLRHVGGLAALEGVDDISQAVLDAALDVSELDSAMLAWVDEAGRLRAGCVTGPLGDVLRETPPAMLEAVAEWVGTGASCYTAGDPRDDVPPTLDALRGQGVAALAALSLATPHRPRGLLVLAGRTQVPLSTDRLELLELLAAHAASLLRTVEALDGLRERAATDPLTGLGHYATFHETLAGAHRRPRTAVLLCDIDGFKHLNDTFGHQHGDEVLRRTAAALEGALRRGDRLFRIGGDEFAALLAVADEAEALEAGNRLRAAVREARLGLTVSIGVAVPADGEPDGAVLGRADRALYRVKASGRDGVALAESGPPTL
jgi:diguanylate cyclase (GGDEF)-like protein